MCHIAIPAPQNSWYYIGFMCKSEIVKFAGSQSVEIRCVLLTFVKSCNHNVSSTLKKAYKTCVILIVRIMRMQKYCYFIGFIDIFAIVYKTVEIHCVLLHLVKSRNQWKTIAFIVIFDIMELVNKTVKKRCVLWHLWNHEIIEKSLLL